MCLGISQGNNQQESYTLVILALFDPERRQYVPPKRRSTNVPNGSILQIVRIQILNRKCLQIDSDVKFCCIQPLNAVKKNT
jgi:hypothetical protein